jgi:hypothetical protein
LIRAETSAGRKRHGLTEEEARLHGSWAGGQGAASGRQCRSIRRKLMTCKVLWQKSHTITNLENRVNRVRLPPPAPAKSF